MVERALQQKSGLITIAGEGTSTTLYTLLDMLTHPSRSIASVEQHIEHRLPHVTQMHVSEVISASGALRAALKSDSDVIALHDIEESSALELAQASSNRCLVLVTLRGTSLATALSIKQKLVRKLCHTCAAPHSLSRSESRILEEQADFTRVLAALRDEGVVQKQAAWKDLQFRRAEGCAQCEGGYKGLLGIEEVSEGGEAPLNCIEDALFKAAQGLTSTDEVVRLAAHVRA
jgi:type II secretory ATPase GspE/PulE/Tfp pilus assembly ATPase PilB-like protein